MEVADPPVEVVVVIATQELLGLLMEDPIEVETTDAAITTTQVRS